MVSTKAAKKSPARGSLVWGLVGRRAGLLAEGSGG
jgi:hypothetical protein